MRWVSVGLYCISCLLFVGQASASGTSADQVICIEKKRVRVFNNELNKVIGRIKRHAVVKIFQSFDGENAQFKSVHGKDHKYIQIQSEDGLIGWIRENYVQIKSDCPGVIKHRGKKRRPASDRANRLFLGNGLSDPSCCQFPIAVRPHNDFTQGMARFGANRNGGRRKHAASDLYQDLRTPILAVKDGEVLKDLYLFYKKTYALEVIHDGGFVVRYGEITSKRPPIDVSAGASVAKGQTVGYMGKIKTRKKIPPMLHFELFSGERKGSLSGKGKYRRRADLINPSQYLIRWQN
jgi:murein DD-endopeptidase MepM/ murein hydrolase activator NlpD